MGYDLMKNFERPYHAVSISDFWKRWHISLSTWFRDYLYIPLGGNKVVKWHWYYNLMVVFLVSGFWHGANWTFLLWGGLHGFYLIFSIWTADIRTKFTQFIRLDQFPGVHKVVKLCITFHLVLLGWIFFRANSITDGYYIIQNLFADLTLKTDFLIAGITRYDVLLGCLLIIFMELIHWMQKQYDIKQLLIILSETPAWFRWSVYTAFVLAILNLGNAKELPFIYFQF